MEPFRDNEDFKGAVRIFKKRVKTVSFESHPLGHFGPFLLFLTFRTAPLKSSLSLIAYIGYPDMGKVKKTLSFSHNIKKVR